MSSGPPPVVARGLVKRFGTFTAVDAIDVEIAPGESTTIRLLLFGVNSDDPKSAARPDVGKLVDVIEKKL